MTDITDTIDPRRFLSQCVGKEAYDDPSLARRILNRRNRGGRRLTLYKCPYCRLWHMGANYKPPRRRY